MIKTTYKHRNIVIIAENNNDFIRLQQTLLDNGLSWYSGTRHILYSEEQTSYFRVDLHNRNFGMGEVGDARIISLRPNTDSKIYDITKICSIISIIKYGSIYPTYKPRTIKRI